MKNSQVCIHTNDKKYELSTILKEGIKPREFSAAITHKTKPNMNALNNQIWDKDEIIYWKQDSFYEFLPKEKQIALTKLAFLESSYETPLVVRQRNKSTADAQLVVNWLTEKDEPFFKGRGSVLAFAWGPDDGLGGDITMNAAQPWWFGKLTLKQAYDLGMISGYAAGTGHLAMKTFDPLHTMKHEGGGHALGMRHLEDQMHATSAIMFPYYNGLRKFGQADLTYLHSLYGSASLSNKVKSLFLDRIDFYS